MGNILHIEKPDHFLFGDIVDIKKVGPSDTLTMSGYVSTKAPDLMNEVVEPSAFKKHLKRYQDNPIYCFNHERDFPIGTVANIKIDDKGLYLEGITLLEEYKFVKDYVKPAITQGILKQQSIGFLSLEHEYTPSGLLVHKEVYLLESSIVSVACNPTAILDFIGYKAFKLYNTVDEFADAYNKGLVTIDKKFFVPDTYAVEETIPMKDTEIKTEVKSAYEAIMLADEELAKYDPEGVSVSKPSKENKSYNSLMRLVTLLKSNSNGGYAYEIGGITAKGFNYSFDKVAIAMCKTLGARGGIDIDNDGKLLLIKRLEHAYSVLGKNMPLFDNVPLKECNPDLLIGADITFSNVQFQEEENLIFEKAIYETDVTNVISTTKRLTDNEFLKEQVLTNESVLKYISPYLSLCVYAVPETDAEVELITKLSQAIVEHFRKLREADSDSYDSIYSNIDRAIDDLSKSLDAADTSNVSEKVLDEKEELVIDTELTKALLDFKNSFRNKSIL